MPINYPAFVTAALGDQGASAFYRIALPLLMADAKNYIQLRLPNKMLFFAVEQLEAIKPDAILFHRSHTEDQKKYLLEIRKKLEVVKVTTIDDWADKLPKESQLHKYLTPGAPKEIKKFVGLCDRLIVTNDLLANVYGYKKETHVIPNYLSWNVWESIYEKGSTLPNNEIKARIGWSGALGHPGDLKLLREVADILGDRVQWVFLGDMPPGFDQGNSEVHNPVIPPQYHKALFNLKLDLALAPLLDNDFNRAKSNLRLLEYGACKYPVIASNVQPYRGAPVTLLEYNAKWWAQEILKKLEDRDVLRQEGQDLYDWVWRDYKLEDHLKEYGDVLSPDGQSFVPEGVDNKSPVVDVLITTYNHKETVEQCVNSVLQSRFHNETPLELIVLDDASTEPELVDYLDTLKKEGVDQVIRQPTNIGYTNNINYGLQLHPNRDVVTLNSDTLVNNNWVDRLRQIAYSEERIASVTPWSNNGSVISYPNSKPDSKTSPDLVAFYDSLASKLDGKAVDLPSSVGYACFIKREALATYGLFDDHAYNRSYGEENDWSVRLIIRGRTNVIGYNTYVGHVGGVSLGADMGKLAYQSALTLTSRHPNYAQVLEQWMKLSPLTDMRQRLDVAAIERTSVKERTLYIAHGYGGGLETYLQSRLKDQDNAIIIRNDTNFQDRIKLECQGGNYFNLPIISERLSNLPVLANILRRFNINKISVQTTFGYLYNFPVWVMNLAKALGLRYEVMLHDYLTICPRLRLVQVEDYCGEPSVQECNKCVMTYGSVAGQVDVRAWRSMYSEFLQYASLVTAPSYDLANRISKYFDIPIEIVPHESDVKIREFNGNKKWDGKEEIRVAVMGALTPDKGSLIIERCAKDCERYDVPMKFIVFGELVDNLNGLRVIQPTKTLNILGRYEEQNINALLAANTCHCAFIPSLCPESYSYTLSHAFRAGLWPFAFDIGAPAERIKSMSFGTVMPYDFHNSPSEIIKTIKHLVPRDTVVEYN